MADPFETFKRPVPADYATQRYGTPFDPGPLDQLLLGTDRADRIATGRTARHDIEAWNKAAQNTPGYADQPTNSQSTLASLIDFLIRGARR